LSARESLVASRRRAVTMRQRFAGRFAEIGFGPVDANLADQNFGKVTSALGARQIQLIARLSFYPCLWRQTYRLPTGIAANVTRGAPLRP